ncbi:pyocin knob domain-containing protein, partial [Streptococcus lutetiensis]|uniref:pyocin knob domain-containing protein n=1 Tax=Streptococcus lutetiensis TaxID=150055 RepID=UPI001C9E6F3A
YKNKEIQHHQLTRNDGTAIMLTDGSDLNDVTSPGCYNGSNLLHAPANGWNYIRVTKHTNNNGYVLQEAIAFYGNVSAYRVQTNKTWGSWQYYAVQNKVAEFTAVNQTKSYSKEIGMPYSSKATATRIGNQVQLTWHRAISNINKQCEYVEVSETIPLGYRPAFEVHMNLSGNVSNSVNAWAVLHLATDGKIRLTNSYTGNHVWTGTVTYLTTDPFP